MIGILVAMESELKPYFELPHTVEKIGGKLFYHLNIGDKHIVVVLSGIGKVNSSHAATLMINLYRPKLIISTGVSGGLGKSHALDIVVASATCQHDVDTTALGDAPGFVSTVNKVYFETDKAVSDIFCKILNCKSGILASGDCFVADYNLSKKITETFNAVACDMESGAIGQVCFIEKIPYTAIRCISDGAGEFAGLSYLEMLDKASSVLAASVLEVIKRLD